MEFANGTCLDVLGGGSGGAVSPYSIEIGNEECPTMNCFNPSSSSELEFNPGLNSDKDDWPETPRNNVNNKKYRRRSLMGTYG